MPLGAIVSHFSFLGHSRLFTWELTYAEINMEAGSHMFLHLCSVVSSPLDPEGSLKSRG